MRPEETLLGQPIRSLQTMLRVIAEDDSRYPSIVPDGIYGPDTLTAVSAFQRINRLPMTGVADQSTWEAITQKYDNAIDRIGPAQSIEILLEPGQVIRLGEQNPYLYLLQPMLIFISESDDTLTPPVLTGVMDPATAAALRQVQAIYGLPISGELDRITWKHIVHHFNTNASQSMEQAAISKNK